MPFTAVLLIVATVLPLAAFFLLLCVGRRMGAPLAGYVTTFFLALSFLCGGWAMMRWVGGGSYHGQPYGRGNAPLQLRWFGAWATVHWRPQGGIYVDSLVIGLVVTITLAAMLVGIFTARSMRRRPSFERLFAWLSLGTFAVLAMVLCESLAYQLVFYELLGCIAAAMIGLGPDARSARRAALRVFAVHRAGDIALLSGLVLLLASCPSLMFPSLWSASASGATGTATFTAACTLLFFGVASRCGQFPFQFVAADAAEGVAASMAIVWSVALAIASVYLVARMFPLFTASVRLLIAIIGVTTLAATALIAAVETDLKKTIAWAAAAQVGLIMLGLGVGSWTGATFHLVAFIFFQTLLILASASVVRAARGQMDIRRLGGMARAMPVTAVTSAVAVLAACGVGWMGVGLSGYYSQGLLLRHAGAFAVLTRAQGRSGMYWCFFVIPLAASCILSFALVRWWMLVFAGSPRDPRVSEHARETPILYWPLVILAIMTGLAGKWLGIGEMLDSSIVEARQVVPAGQASAQRAVFAAAWPSDEEEGATPAIAAALHLGERLAERWRSACWMLGIVCALLLYARGDRAARRLASVRPARWLHAWLANRMYFDDLYGTLFTPPIVATVAASRKVDRLIVLPVARRIGDGSYRAGERIRMRLRALRKRRTPPAAPAEPRQAG